MPPRRRLDPLLLLYVVAVVAVTLQKGYFAPHPGNFLLFRHSFHRLVSRADIYNPPAGEMTGFLYSPTFALLFAPFAVLPLLPGLLLWNGANALVLYFGLTRLLHTRAAQLALLIVFLDLLRSLQNSQSNALVAGLVILGFLALEREHVALGSAAFVGGAFIKIYPIVGGVLGLTRPRSIRFLLVFSAVAVLFAALPILVLPPPTFLATYREWWSIIQRDTTLQGQSIMRFLSSLVGSMVPSLPVQLAGAALLLAPLLARRAHWTDRDFRVRWLCAMLIFFVVFNHQAESASFVVASTGAAIWYVTSPTAWWRALLVALALVFETLPHAFFMPHALYRRVIGPYALDAIPMFVIWLVIHYELWRWPSSRHEQQVTSTQPVTDLG